MPVAINPVSCKNSIDGCFLKILARFRTYRRDHKVAMEQFFIVRLSWCLGSPGNASLLEFWFYQWSEAFPLIVVPSLVVCDKGTWNTFTKKVRYFIKTYSPKLLKTNLVLFSSSRLLPFPKCFLQLRINNLLKLHVHLWKGWLEPEWPFPVL